jgi:hypothetical protein
MSFQYETFSLFSKVEPRITSLRRGLDIYSLGIEVRFTPNNPKGRAFLVTDLHVGIEFGTEKQVVGVARPVPAELSNTEGFVVVAPSSTGQREQSQHFRSYLCPAALEALEAARNGMDAVFQMTVCGTTALHAGNATKELKNPEKGSHVVPLPVSQSQWVKLLEEAGYQRSILLEIGLPKADELGVSANHITDAQNAFAQGRYSDVVARCRDALDALIPTPNCPWEEAKNLKGRENMSAEDRLRLSWCAIRHVTHAPHHPNSVKVEFTRPMAHYVLGATCLALSLASKERELFIKPTQGAAGSLEPS